jgi:hypothetical protein
MTAIAEGPTVVPAVPVGRNEDGRGLSARDVEAFVAAWDLGGRRVPLDRYLGVEVQVDPSV